MTKKKSDTKEEKINHTIKSILKNQGNLSEQLLNQFGFNGFKDPQEEIIKNLLSGNDTFVIMPTGGGKSLCYQLPAIISEGVAIIVSPLIALMKNQVDLVRSYSSKDDVAHFLNSTLNKSQQKIVKDDLISGKTKMLYVAPETLTKEENVAFFKQLNVSFFAVDEAHCISEWGHDFRPEYRRLREVMDLIDITVPVIALTATATPKVQSDIIKNLGLRKPKIFISSFNRPNLYYEIQPKINLDQTNKSIVRFIQLHKNKSGIIYTLNRKTTEDLAKMLEAQENQQKLQKLGFEDLNSAQKEYNRLVAEGASQSQLEAKFKDEALKSQLESVSQQERLSAITGRLQELFIGLMELLMPVFDVFMDIFEKAIKPIMKVLTPVLKVLGDIFQGVLVPALNMIMEPIKEIGTLIEEMLPAGTSLGNTFKTIGQIIGPFILAPFRAVFFVIDTIKEQIKGMFSIFEGIGDILQGNITEGLKKVGMGIMRTVLSPIQAIIDLAIGLVNNIIDGLNNVPGIDISPIKKFNVTDAVFMAEGGIVTGPTKAVIGEAGSEAVIPLDKFYAKLDELISVVKSGGNIYLDGTKVGTAMNVSTYKVQ